MKTYYCDGSSHKERGKMGIGVVSEDMKTYYEIESFKYGQMTHEIEAIIRAIRMAKDKSSEFRVINDDKHLVKTIQNNLLGIKVKSKGLASKPRFHYLLDLIKKYNVAVDIPRTKEEKAIFKECHDLSRTYIK